MKLAYLLLVFAVPFIAHAEDATPPKAKVLRYGHVEGIIRQQSADDSAALDQTDLCTFEGEAPVYGDPSDMLNQSMEQYVKACDVKFNGKEMRVELNINVNEYKPYTDKKSGRVTPARKTLSTDVFVFEKDTGEMFYSQVSGASSLDFSVRSLGAFITPSVFETAKLPKGSLSFSADITFTEER